MMPRKCLVAGLGNPLQGSDGFGQAVLARLGERRDLPEHTELLDAHTDLLGYVARFASYDLVVLVDAILGPGPREIAVFEEEVFGAWVPEAPGCHQVSPLLAVQLFRLLVPRATTRFVLVGLKEDAADFVRPITTAEAQAGSAAVAGVLIASPA